MDTRKLLLLDAIDCFIRQRPKFDFANYGDVAAYRADARVATRQLNDARVMLQALHSDSITADDILAECKTGRFTVQELEPGVFQCEYVAGQYYCTEYRAGVCRSLSGVLWEYVRRSYPQYDGDEIRRYFARWFGRGLAKRWFN